MSGLINIEEYNKKIIEIEQAKNILDRAKPALFKSLKINGVAAIYLKKDNNGSIQEKVSIFADSWASTTNIKIKELRALAACVIKLTGAMTKEEFDEVDIVVE